ncbi:MAG: hypothetical protein IKR19_00295, partial [Acholeplasmatales bacterium]|nr:hypothetical protein [Acholeplasmatales bacterium]
LKGLVVCIAAIVVASFIDYFLFKINGSFFVGIILIGPIIGVTISNSYEKYHIKYSLIAIGYTLIGMLLLNLFRLLLIYNFSNLGALLSSGETWFMIFLHPIRAIVNAFRINEVANYFFSIIELILYIGTFFLAYKLSKKKQAKNSEK